MRSALIFLAFVVLARGQHNPNFVPGHTGIVHLFEWKWVDVAAECERFLGPMGFGGVQVSSPAENAIVRDPLRPWWERYHIISYKLVTRSGNEEEFADMCTRCNKVGVRIYVDTVINHMGSLPNMIGTGGSTADGPSKYYPAVPYNVDHFHTSCPIENWQDAYEIHNCELFGAPDLNHGMTYVRATIEEYMNHLIRLGVAGFRIDAAKHINPFYIYFITSDLTYLNDLNPDHGFPARTKAFIYQEVIDFGWDAVSKYDYTYVGTVTEFMYSYYISRAFRGNDLLRNLATWGPTWGFLNSSYALVFVENHDNERGDGAGGQEILSYKDGSQYRMAVAFALAHTYGIPRIMSSFAFTERDIGPPMDSNENIISPSIYPDGSCGNGWVCQHRWRQVVNMIAFRNISGNENITNWWTNDKNQIAFARYQRGFIAFNNDAINMNVSLQTSLPAGIYCDVISGNLVDKVCTGKNITVRQDGVARILIMKDEEDQVVAFHVGQMISSATLLLPRVLPGVLLIICILNKILL